MPGADVTVRMGQFRSPFYDSVVVIALTIDSGATTHMVLDAASAAWQAAHLSVSGRPGRVGNQGSSGGQGPGPCMDGGAGGDGGMGWGGGEGGSFSILVQEDHRRLLDFIVTSNRGGPGGPGGRGGAGGDAGQNSPDCAIPPRNGSPGHTGPSGPPGASGPPNQVRELPPASLWQESPSWANPATRKSQTRCTSGDYKYFRRTL